MFLTGLIKCVLNIEKVRLASCKQVKTADTGIVLHGLMRTIIVIGNQMI